MRAALATVSLLLAPGVLVGGVATSEMPAIVARSIEYHGGARYRASETELEQCSLSGCYQIRVLVDGDRFEHEASLSRDDFELRVILTNNDLRVWQDGEPVELDDDLRRRRSSWVSARTYFPFLPYRLADARVRFEDLGLVRWGDQELHKVRVTFDTEPGATEEDQYLYWFSPETAAMVQLAYSYAGNPGGIRFRRAENCRRIEGIMFCDHENLGIDADGLAVDQVTPTFVETQMRPVSKVELSNIRVRLLQE